MDLLSVQDVSKRFGAVKALDSVSLSVKRGEVLGLAGENGAGKSTLVKLLCGVHKHEEGQFIFEGETLNPQDPSDAEDRGISVFHQEIPICPHLSISANVFLGSRIPSKGIRPDWEMMNRRTRELFEDLLGEDIDPTMLIKDCTVPQRQLALLVRVLSRNAKLVILDEPTTALTPPEVRKLFQIILRLKEKGISFIFVSHMLDELVELSDRITVLRDGENVGELAKKEFDQRKISELIAGRALDSGWQKTRRLSDEKVLECCDLRTASGLDGVSFTLRKGEILGIAGLQGSGRSLLPRSLFGLEKIAGGELLLKGEPVSLSSPGAAIARKIGYVPEDRKTVGLFSAMDIQNNLFISRIDEARGPLGVLNRKKMNETTGEMRQKLGIKMTDGSASINSLSGGNQQKVLIGRWLALKPEILVMNEPTRGVDVGAKEEICKLITALTDEGFSFVVASSELEELMAMSDRIMVMRKGRISRIFEKGEFSKDKIILASTSDTGVDGEV